MYAVISDRSRQHTVRSGDVILCDLQAEQQVGDKITFDDVLLVSHEGTIKLGHPFVAGASVVGEVLGEKKGDKVIAFRFKRRKNVRRKRGHRQHYTQVKIAEING
ncbi:MAG: 50S ribosomal protein L21 [Planctomycetes bacterium]|nr:50S ribosomal protein L21 [Planctomycetota bacterium]